MISILYYKILNNIQKNGKKSKSFKIFKELKNELYIKRNICFYNIIEKSLLNSLIPFSYIKRKKGTFIKNIPYSISLSKGIFLSLKKIFNKKEDKKLIIKNILSSFNKSGKFYLNYKKILLAGLKSRNRIY